MEKVSSIEGLFQVLTMGHSQFAQFTGIRGPTTTINLACASATGAFQIAEDWLAADRVDRVVILSADDVTGDDLWEWIGSGFASTGAASTSNNIEEAALPFDKRRNGLVLGMGAASFVVERKSSADERGVQPIAELLGAKRLRIQLTMVLDWMLNTLHKRLTNSLEKWRTNGA